MTYNRPKFLIPGVAKSGTTSLYFYLNEHPSITIPRKETFYYINDILKTVDPEDPARRKEHHIISDMDEYRKLYSGNLSNMIYGEISTGYLYYYRQSIPRIIDELGSDIKVIIMLRNPIDRAISCYRHFRRDHFEENANMVEAMNLEQERMDRKWDFMWYYKSLGFYHNSIKAFQEAFDNVKIVLFEDLQSQPEAFIHDVFDYIGVDVNFKPNLREQYNVTGKTKNAAVHNFLIEKNHPLKKFLKPIVSTLNVSDKTKYAIYQKIKNLNSHKKRKITEEIDSESIGLLKDLYREDIQRTQDLIQMDLSSWWNK